MQGRDAGWQCEKGQTVTLYPKGKKMWKFIKEKYIWIILITMGFVHLFSYFNDSKTYIDHFKNPSTYITYLTYVAIYLTTIICFYIILRFRDRKKLKLIDSQIDHIKDSIIKSAEETRLMNSDELPSNEDIQKYYKMYCLKHEIDNRDEWTTHEPMTFHEYYSIAIKPSTEVKCRNSGNVIFREEGGWDFLVRSTCDMFSFDPKTGQMISTRFRDYEAMVERNEQNEHKS